MRAFDASALGTILGVWAHPDDETYAMGAIAAAARNVGNRVVLVTATRGEAGSQDEARWPPSELADVRERELAAALAELGVTEHRWFGYPDGGCAQVPYEDAVRATAAIVEEVAPDSVLTFGPDGMTGHPDHAEVSRWTTEAFWRAAPAGARLLYATTREGWVDSHREAIERLGVSMGGDFPVTPVDELAIDLTVEGDLLERKLRALRAQVSQTASFIDAAGESLYQEMVSGEWFRLAGSK